MPVASINLSARVDLPWSMCATMQKLRMGSSFNGCLWVVREGAEGTSKYNRQTLLFRSHKKKEGCFRSPLDSSLASTLIGGSAGDDSASPLEVPVVEVWRVSRVLLAPAAEILSVCPEREPAVALPCAAPACTREPAAPRLLPLRFAAS